MLNNSEINEKNIDTETKAVTDSSNNNPIDIQEKICSTCSNEAKLFTFNKEIWVNTGLKKHNWYCYTCLYNQVKDNYLSKCCSCCEEFKPVRWTYNKYTFEIYDKFHFDFYCEYCLEQQVLDT